MTDLDRLRREGAARLADADLEKRQRQDEEANERRERDEARVRLAVGRYRYRALRNVVFWMAIPGLAVFAIALGVLALELVRGDLAVALVMGAACWLFGGLWLWNSSVIWRAGAGAMRDEQTWIETRPFALNGYLAWLARSSGSEAFVRLEIRGPRITSRHDDVRTLLAAVHPEVRHEGKGIFLLTDLPGGDDDQRVRIVHEIVDRVLTPVHHESPLEAVNLIDG